MGNFFNIGHNFIFIKDLSDVIDSRLIEDEFSSLKFESNVNNHISVDKNFLDRECFSQLKFIFESETKEFINQSFVLGGNYEDLKITKSWGNITYGGESHHEHSHPFSIVSGVFFLDNNPQNLGLRLLRHMPEIPYFIPNRKIYISMEEIIDGYGLRSQINNLKNHLVLFLSNTSHKVDPTPITSTSRRTIAFNTFWKGQVGIGLPELATMTF